MTPLPTRIALLGCTGSIGRQALQVIETHPDRFSVVGLAAGRNLDLLAEQVARFRPRLVGADVSRDALASAVRETSVAAELVSMVEMATAPDVDVVLVATTGRAGLAPTFAAVRAGKRIALANKEVLVMAGELLLREAARSQSVVHPVDSEHSAVWQSLLGEGAGRCPPDYRPNLVGLCDLAPVVRRLILTASGGAFRDFTQERLAEVTAAQALRHPTWLMGQKVTIDSATLINKGLEVIEARWLFGVPYDQIEVVVHRESIVHSFVEFVDGSLKAQLGVPDMRLPIQYALTHPDRVASGLPALELAKIGCLTFSPADDCRFPGLKLAIGAGRRGGTYPAVMAAADEVAVDLFLKDQIGFLDIVSLVDRVLQAHNATSHPSLDDVLVADEWARRTCLELANA